MLQLPEPQSNYLGFQVISPNRLLRPYVRSYWRFRRDAPLGTARHEYMNPTGGFGIVFNFGDAIWLDGLALSAPIFLDGANTISRRMSFLGQVDMLGVRFFEGGAYPFFGIPLIELRNETTLLDALNRPDLLRLHERLREVGSLPARVHLLEEWLIGRLLLGKERDALLPASLNLLRERTGHLTIQQLARELAISQRQLERIYQSQVGMAPKEYSRLIRVDTARRALKQLNEKSTTRLAVDLGFYDQAHFIREFSAVTGITPYAYLKLNRKGVEKG